MGVGRKKKRKDFTTEGTEKANTQPEIESVAARRSCGNSGRNGVVAFEGFTNHFGGHGAFAADAPMIAVKLDDGGGG